MGRWRRICHLRDWLYGGEAVAFTGSLALLILIFADRVADIVGRAVVPRADCEGDIIGAMAGLLKFKSRSMTSDDRK